MYIKKAQITIFVIISIMILFLVVLFINSKYDFEINDIHNSYIDSKLSPEEEVKRNVEYCLERQTEHAIDWAFFENGNYQSGTAEILPDHPTLLNYDLWYHTFDVGNFNRAGVQPSIEKYLIDTMNICLKSLDEFYLPLEKDNSKIVYSVIVNDNDVKVEMYFPIKLSYSNKEIFLDTFNYVSSKVPVAQMEADVNELVNWFNQYVQLLDGKSDGNTVMKWSNPDMVIQNMSIPVVLTRDDVGVLFELYDSENFGYTIYYMSPYWRESIFKFNIDGITLSSLNQSKYFNNILYPYNETGGEK